MKPVNKSQIFDLHCHPALKYSIWSNEHFYQGPHSTPDGDWGKCYPLSIYYDAPGAKFGGVKILFNSHYVPENGFLNSGLLELLKSIGAADVIEDKDPSDADGNGQKNLSAWDKLQKSIQHFQRLAQEANDKLGDKSVRILAPTDKLDEVLEKYDLVIINAIEGAHHLGRNLGDSSAYISNLKSLKENGFYCFTLSHFFLNDICDTAGGIPQSDLAVANYKIRVSPTPGLTPVGRDVVKWSLENGVLVDLVHSTFEARQQVYKINFSLPKPKPLAFTHTGVRALYRKGGDATYESLQYLPNDDDIDAIKNCNGIMGVILMNNWLCGEDDDYKDKPEKNFQIIFDTIDYICKRCGNSYENIGIGTDLDGFTHVPDNLNQSAQLYRLSQQILNKYKDEIGQKILYQNAYRVLKECCGL